jgi:hypothetical protein
MLNLKPLALLTFAVLCLVPLNDCLPNFFRGKRFNHLQIAHERPHLLADIPDQYFDQRLDHFNEALTTTWKQVRFPQNNIILKYEIYIV